jgi:hypothetical protein
MANEIVMTPERFDALASDAVEALVSDEHSAARRGWALARRVLAACGPPLGYGKTAEDDGNESVAAFRERMSVHAESFKVEGLLPSEVNLIKMRAAAALIPEEEESGLAWTTAYDLSTREGIEPEEALELVRRIRARHPRGLVPRSWFVWSDEELRLRSLLEEGMTVVVNLHSHETLIQWATERDKFVRIDRKTAWGNPFLMGDNADPKDGNRADVIAAYRDHYLPNKPSLRARLDELRGKALGCWCAPEPCHGDVLLEALEASHGH